MKKLFIAILAILMLSACGKQEVPEQPPVEEPEVIHTPVEEEPIVAQPEQEPVEIPVEIVEPEKPAEDDCPIEWETIHVEGLIEDTIAYDLEQLTFSGVDGAEAMSQFYASLVAQLEKHTKETVYPAVMDLHTGANVYGIVSGINYSHEYFEATYEYRVEYLNGQEPESFTRIDRFDVLTGEVIAAEQ